jgi:hypothetical protein
MMTLAPMREERDEDAAIEIKELINARRASQRRQGSGVRRVSLLRVFYRSPEGVVVERPDQSEESEGKKRNFPFPREFHLVNATRMESRRSDSRQSSRTSRPSSALGANRPSSSLSFSTSAFPSQPKTPKPSAARYGGLAEKDLQKVRCTACPTVENRRN